MSKPRFRDVAATASALDTDQYYGVVWYCLGEIETSIAGIEYSGSVPDLFAAGGRVNRSVAAQQMMIWFFPLSLA